MISSFIFISPILISPDVLLTHIGPHCGTRPPYGHMGQKHA